MPPRRSESLITRSGRLRDGVDPPDSRGDCSKMFVDFVASDVPGVPVPVFLGGAPVRAQYAFGPTIGSAVNVTLLTYVDTCALGIDVDTTAIPDYDVFHEALVAGFDEVLALAG